jgi:S-disulfanyl-L-cysteine oxidoreductase SoxD
MRSVELAAVSAALLLGLASVGALAGDPSRPPVSFGTPISEADVAPWNIDIQTPTGKGLPPGQGSVAEGEELFAAQCVVCHGEKAEGGPQYGTMVGGINSFLTDRRVLTPGSMYPYAPILFDYTRRTMPMHAPQTLTDDQVYALVAYIYHLNDLLPADAVLDAQGLIAIEMPNRDGFIVDDRPDTSATRCMENCM